MTNRPRIGSWCSGYRGLDMAVEAVFGGTTAWVSDVDPGANRILAHHWPTTPNLGDLTATDWRAAVDEHGPVGIVCGGYPCQPFSTAGKRKGTNDERHLWPHIAGALRILRPRVAIFENVANHLRIGFDTVLRDLADIGFDAEWVVVRASDVLAPHERRRLFILATPTDAADLGHERAGAARGRRNGSPDRGDAAAHPHGDERLGESDERRGKAAASRRGNGLERTSSTAADSYGIGGGPVQPVVRAGEPDSPWGSVAPAIARWEAATGRPAPWATDDRGRLSPAFVEWLMGLPAGHVTGVPGLTRAQQLKGLGNGVVPQQAEAAIRLLAARAGLATRTRSAAAA